MAWISGGNAWQYTFYVPHVPQELVKLVGKDLFNQRLDSIFTVSQKNVFGGGTQIDAFAGLLKVFIIMVINQTCISHSIFLVDLI
jgi:putative alpha-1,2-mannosidase